MIRIQTLLDLLTSRGFAPELTGDAGAELDGFSSLGRYREGTMTWARGAQALADAPAKDIFCLVLPRGVEADARHCIRVDDPRAAFFFLLGAVWGAPRKAAGIGAGTRVSPEAAIDPSASVGCNCVIDGPVRIGAGTVIEHNVTIFNRVEIGENCIIHSGAVIGADGFGYTYDADDRPVKIEHFGGVTIGDRVEIGANACIHRGTIDDTIIGSDAKIDALVHVAHNDRIGEASLVVAGAVLCGSVEVGERSYLAPGVIVRQGVRLGESFFAGMGTVVTRAEEANAFVYQKPPVCRLTDVNYRERIG